MTEDEAKESWCPFMRPGEFDARGSLAMSVSTNGKAILGNKCIASACMAWRWTPGQETAMFKEDVEKQRKMVQASGYGGSDHADVVWRNRVNRKRDYEHADGHCGLAGP